MEDVHEQARRLAEDPAALFRKLMSDHHKAAEQRRLAEIDLERAHARLQAATDASHVMEAHSMDHAKSIGALQSTHYNCGCAVNRETHQDVTPRPPKVLRVDKQDKLNGVKKSGN